MLHCNLWLVDGGWWAQLKLATLLPWVWEDGCRDFGDHMSVMAAAAGSGELWLASLQWLREQGCVWNECAWRNAAYFAHSDIMQ